MMTRFLAIEVPNVFLGTPEQFGSCFGYGISWDVIDQDLDSHLMIAEWAGVDPDEASSITILEFSEKNSRQEWFEQRNEELDESP